MTHIAITWKGSEVLAIDWGRDEGLRQLAAAIGELTRRGDAEDDDDPDPPFQGGHTVACSMEREVEWPEPVEPDPEDRRRYQPRIGFQ